MSLFIKSSNLTYELPSDFINVIRLGSQIGRRILLRFDREI